jgi:hypothetical protein
LEVTPENAEKRKRVSDAFSSWVALHEAMNGPVAYYFDDDGKKAEAAAKLDHIANILGKHPPDTADCRALEAAFGFEFEGRSSVLRRWCESVSHVKDSYTTLAQIKK